MPLTHGDIRNDISAAVNRAQAQRPARQGAPMPAPTPQQQGAPKIDPRQQQQVDMLGAKAIQAGQQGIPYEQFAQPIFEAAKQAGISEQDIQVADHFMRWHYEKGVESAQGQGGQAPPPQQQ